MPAEKGSPGEMMMIGQRLQPTVSVLTAMIFVAAITQADDSAGPVAPDAAFIPPLPVLRQLPEGIADPPPMDEASRDPSSSLSAVTAIAIWRITPARAASPPAIPKPVT